MRNFSITVKHIRACWWWRAHTGRDKQAHSSVLFLPLHTSTRVRSLARAHTPASLAKADLSLPHLCCSALLCVDQGSCLGYNQLNWRWRTLNPSLYVLLYPLLYSQQREGMSQTRGGKEQAIPFARVLCDHKENPLIWFLYAWVKKHKVAASLTHADTD